jgi:hypothetical protein
LSGYQKFSDSWRDDATERNAPKTLAGLATLAGVKGQNSKADALGTELEKSDSGAAKVAKAAKVETPEAAEPSLAYRAASVGPDGTGCKVEIVELPAAGRYRKVFAFLQLKPPALVPVERWKQCVKDGSRFLAKWGEQAEALGWTPADLFGLHTPPERPHPSYNRLSRYDCTGLCWLLQGRPIVALTADTAAIENPATGAITTYRRFNKPALGPLGDSVDDFKA